MVVVLSKPRLHAPREALHLCLAHPRVVDLGHCSPRDTTQVDRSDFLRLVLRCHHCIPLHPQLGRRTSRSGSLGSARREAVFRLPKIRAVWSGLASSRRNRHGQRVWVRT